MNGSVIGKLYNDFTDISTYLLQENQITFNSDLERYFKKIFILSIASQFEHQIHDILMRFTQNASSNSFELVSFVRKKAISMNYHTFFNWGDKNEIDKPGKNANSFFALFGDEFKKSAEADVKEDINLNEGIRAFLELGHIRNILAHSNFAAYPFENKTIEEIVALYKQAELFIQYIEQKLVSKNSNWNGKIIT